MKLNIYDYEKIIIKKDIWEMVPETQVLAAALLKFFNPNLEIIYSDTLATDMDIYHPEKCIYIGFEPYLYFTNDELNKEVEQDYGSNYDIASTVFDIFNNKFRIKQIIEDYIFPEPDIFDFNESYSILDFSIFFHKNYWDENDDATKRFHDYVVFILSILKIYYRREKYENDLIEHCKKFMDKDNFYSIIPSMNDPENVQDTLIRYALQDRIAYQTIDGAFGFFSIQRINEENWNITFNSYSFCYFRSDSIDSLRFSIKTNIRQGYRKIVASFKDSKEAMEFAERTKKEIINHVSTTLDSIIYDIDEFSSIFEDITKEGNVILHCIKCGFIPEDVILEYYYKIITEYQNSPMKLDARFRLIYKAVVEKAREIKNR